MKLQAGIHLHSPQTNSVIEATSTACLVVSSCDLDTNQVKIRVSLSLSIQFSSIQFNSIGFIWNESYENNVAKALKYILSKYLDCTK